MSATGTKLVNVQISDRAGARVERGHLWIFSNEIIRPPATLEPGSLCKFVSSGRPVGIGYYNGHSLIAGRILAREDADNVDGLVSLRLKRAFAQRAPLPKDGAARLVFGESDLLPGFVIDVFGSAVVIQTNTAGADRLLADVEAALPEAFKAAFGHGVESIVIRADASIRKLEGIPESVRVSKGDEKKLRSHVFSEQGTLFSADLINGQKTGFFLDQRDNRDHLSRLVASNPTSRVLDLFCYSGGWGLRALKAGAEHVTFVDDSAEALALVEAGIVLNGFSESKSIRLKRDAFDFLNVDKEKYDVVVADPPAFAKSKKDVGAATRAYEKLFRLAWRRVRPGGLLVACSCSYQVSEDDFLHSVVSAIGKEKGIAQIARRGEQASDHPVLLGMPETRYLKCLFLKKIPA